MAKVLAVLYPDPVDGQAVYDTYSQQRVIVVDGKVKLNAAGTVLLERAIPLLAR